MANEVRVARLESLIKDVINNALANEINDKIAKLARVTAVSYTHLTLPTTPYV